MTNKHDKRDKKFFENIVAPPMNELNNKIDDSVQQVMGHLRTASGYYREGQDKDGDYELAYATQKLQALITEQVRLGSLAELEGIMNCWEHPSLAPYFLTDRIAQLKDTTLLEGEKK